MSLFVRVQGPTAHGALWRLSPSHMLAMLSFFARQWGEISYVSFPRARGQGRLLGYGTVTFADAKSVPRVLQAAAQQHGRLRIPFSTQLEDPESIAYASLAECDRALTASPSLRDSVAMHAPLAPSAKNTSYDCFYVKVERSEKPFPQAPMRRPTPLVRKFDGFSGQWAERVAYWANKR